MCSADTNRNATKFYKVPKGLGGGLSWGLRLLRRGRGKIIECSLPILSLTTLVIKHQRYKCNSQNQRLPAHRYEGEMDQNNLTALIADSEKPPLLS